MRPFMLRLGALGFAAYRSIIYCKFKNLDEYIYSKWTCGV